MSATIPRPVVGRPALRIAGIAAIVVAALLLIVVLLFDWNWLKGPIERRVTERTGRVLVLGGDISGTWSYTPRLTFRDVRFANPDWASSPQMLEAEEVSAEVRLVALFRRPLMLESLLIRGAKVALEVGADGKRSWRLDKEQSDSEATVRFRRIVVERAVVGYLDTAQDTDLSATVGAPAGGSTEIELSGRVRATPLTLAITTAGAAEALAAASSADAPSPLLRGKGRIGAAIVEFTGRLGPGYALAGTRVQVQAKGPDLSAFRSLARAAVPATPPYRINAEMAIGEGRVDVDLKPSTFGESALSGKMAVLTADERPRVEGTFIAAPLHLGDLGRLIGAAPTGGTGRSETSRMGDANADVGSGARILPSTAFDTTYWPNVDLDLTLEAQKVIDSGWLAVDAFTFRARLSDGDLEVSPLSVSIAGGRIEGSLSLQQQQKSIALRSKVRFSGLQLGRILPSSEKVVPSAGVISGAIELAGQGNSIGRVAAASNGRISLAMGPGEVSNLLLEMIGLDAGQALGLLAKGDRPVKLRCAVASMPIENGTARAEAVVFDTEDTHIVMTGSANLANETLDFTLRPRPKDFSLLSARSPIHLRGTFADPAVSVDAGALAARAAGAVLLGLLNPLAALIPLIETGSGEDAPCRELLREVRSAAEKAAPKK